MTHFSTDHQGARLIDGAAHAVERIQTLAQSSAHHSLDGAASALQTLIDEVSPKLNRVAQELNAISEQGIKSVEVGTHYLSHRAHQAADSTVGYIRKEPATAVLLAAGVGAILVAAWVLVTHKSHSSTQRFR